MNIRVLLTTLLVLSPVCCTLVSPTLANSTPLIYLHNRAYDPSLNRFVSPDPAGAGNAYAYANNGPALAVDPSGLSPDLPTNRRDPFWKNGDAQRSHWGADLAPIDKYVGQHSYLAASGRRVFDSPNVEQMYNLLIQAAAIHYKMEAKKVVWAILKENEFSLESVPLFMRQTEEEQVDILLKDRGVYGHYLSGADKEKLRTAVSITEGLREDIDEYQDTKYKLDTDASGDAYGFDNSKRDAWQANNASLFSTENYQNIPVANFLAYASDNEPVYLARRFGLPTAADSMSGLFFFAAGGAAWKGIKPVAGRIAGEFAVGGAAAEIWNQGSNLLDGRTYMYGQHQQQVYNWAHGIFSHVAPQASIPSGSASCLVHTQGC